jgi:hypothetical protein
MMDSASIHSQEPVDQSDHGELQQWIEENPELTEAEKELYREINPSI